MSTELTKVVPPQQAVRDIMESEQAKVADGVAASVSAGFRIATPEDAQQAADTLSILKRSVKAAKDGLTEAFRPMKALEKSLRGLIEPRIGGWDRAAMTVDAELTRFRRAEEARIRREQEEAQRQADAAAKAAAAANAALTDEEEPLPAAQVVLPKVESITRGAVGKVHVTRRTEAVEIVDLKAVAEHWPHLAVLDKSTAKAEFDLLVKRGNMEPPPEDGVVVGGIRFRTVVSNVSGRAS